MNNQPQSHLKTSLGIPVVMSAPSGGGKSTLAELVLKINKNISRSISCTTRPIRPGEKDGRDYFFIDEPEFRKRIKAGQFLEWATVHEHYYGTPVVFMSQQLHEGKDVLLVIDPQGAVSVRQIYPHGIFIFIVPPSWEILKRRLKSRRLDDSKSMSVRLTNAAKELTYLNHYDFLVVNDKLDNAVEDVLAILRSEHLRVSRLNRKTIPILR